MIVYHGSNVVVKSPKIICSNRYLDFGTGFYTTTNLERAANFSKKVFARNKEGGCYVSVYEVDETFLSKMKVLRFEEANEQWLDFVSDNRNGVACKKHPDLIIGPVANDDVYRTFALYTSGILNKEQTLQALKVKKLYNQVVFASEKSLGALNFLKTIEANKNE